MIRLVAWSLVAGLGILALTRLSFWDAPAPALLGIYGLGPLPYLAAAPVAVIALARRHVRLGLVALAVAAVVLPLGLPEIAARSALPPAARTAPRIRILSWNMYQSNADAVGLDEIVRDADPDVVVVQELSALNIGAVQSSSALASFPHTLATPMASAFGSGIWSRLPLEDAGKLDVDGLPMTRATILTPAGPVRLVNVHVLAPLEGGRPAWERQLRLLGEEARRPGPPILLAGDFNATWGHHPFRRLLTTGLSDAAAARGALWAPTWPDGRRLLPPLLRLDHVLTGPGLVATSYATGPAGGSDHRSIVADIAVIGAR